jgi:hypothetical protein
MALFSNFPGIIFLSISSGLMDVLEVLASGMIRSGGGLGQGPLYLLELADAISLSALSQLSLSQSKARLTSTLMEMTPHGPGIFKTK